jgi:hypothetical protein
MKPYLLLYYQWAYSLDFNIQHHAMDTLYNKLRRLQQYNPRFGRKIIKYKKVFKEGRFRYKGVVYFDDIHLPFNVPSKYFSLNHIDAIQENDIPLIETESDQEENDEEDIIVDDEEEDEEY